MLIVLGLPSESGPGLGVRCGSYSFAFPPIGLHPHGPSMTDEYHESVNQSLTSGKVCVDWNDVVKLSNVSKIDHLRSSR